MGDIFGRFLLAWVLTQIASILMLLVGSRLAHHPALVRVGEKAHERKLSALDRIWPLTKLRGAAEREELGTCTAILAPLIVLKSLGSMVFGLIMVVWLPIASLMVPSIVAVHDPSNPELARWILKVAVLQVTSHALAAAVGFGLTIAGPLAGVSLGSVIQANLPTVLLGLILSLVLAVLAGREEAKGLLKHGI